MHITRRVTRIARTFFISTYFVSTFPLMLLAVGITNVALAQPTPAPAADAAAQRQRVEALYKQPDIAGTGKYAAMKEEVATLPDHVVYRPKDLGALGNLKLGVVAWGNGACSADGASARFHLLEIASHGYLIIASGKIWSGPGAPQSKTNAAGQPDVGRTEQVALTAAIDWALQENERSGSPYFHRIDANAIAASGFSCGGLQALRAGADPRVKTLVLNNTGILNEGPSTAIPGMDLVKDELKKIHGPTLYILGTATDIAYPNGMDDFKRLEHVPVAVANLPIGHGGNFMEPVGGPVAQVAVNWLQWQLRGDKEAAKMFVGKDCGLCRDNKWTYESKGL